MLGNFVVLGMFNVGLFGVGLFSVGFFGVGLFSIGLFGLVIISVGLFGVGMFSVGIFSVGGEEYVFLIVGLKEVNNGFLFNFFGNFGGLNVFGLLIFFLGLGGGVFGDVRFGMFLVGNSGLFGLGLDVLGFGGGLNNLSGLLGFGGGF